MTMLSLRERDYFSLDSLFSVPPGAPQSPGKSQKSASDTKPDPVDDGAKYLGQLEQNIPGVERDFFEAMRSQDREEARARAKRGRAAVLRMSHDASPNNSNQETAPLRKIVWKRPRGPFTSQEDYIPTSSASGLPETPTGFVFDNLDTLREALSALPRPHNQSESPQFFEKQMILLEDLGRDWVVTIGQAFHIPPRVFADQWVSPTCYKGGEARLPLGEPPEEHFLVPYSEVLHLESKLDKKKHRLDCSSVRVVSPVLQDDDEEADKSSYATCEGAISFWGLPGQQREWTAILLVDPHPNSIQLHQKKGTGGYHIVPESSSPESPEFPEYIRLISSKQRSMLRSTYGESSFSPMILKATFFQHLQRTGWTPINIKDEHGRSGESETFPILTDELLSGEKSVYNPEEHSFPRTRYIQSPSVFDQILGAVPPAPNSHPVHATQSARRIILAKMAILVDIYLRKTYVLTLKAMQNIRKIADFDPQRLGEKPWQEEWRSESFTGLWELKSNIELLGFDMQNTTSLFSDIAENHSGPGMDKVEKDNIATWNASKIRNQDLNDLKEWNRLEATRKYASGFIERTTNSYLQAATAEGAKFSNLQARTSKKITFLATLFVPASLCAAILALPGYSGAQGPTRFWLFWVVSVPVAVILAVTLLFQDIRTFISERRKNEKSGKTGSNESAGIFHSMIAFLHRRKTDNAHV